MCHMSSFPSKAGIQDVPDVLTLNLSWLINIELETWRLLLMIIFSFSTIKLPVLCDICDVPYTCSSGNIK